jgi:hypothetical protein
MRERIPPSFCGVGEGFFRKTAPALLRAPNTTPEDVATFKVFARALTASLGGT